MSVISATISSSKEFRNPSLFRPAKSNTSVETCFKAEITRRKNETITSRFQRKQSPPNTARASFPSAMLYLHLVLSPFRRVFVSILPGERSLNGRMLPIPECFRLWKVVLYCDATAVMSFRSIGRCEFHRNYGVCL